MRKLKEWNNAPLHVTNVQYLQVEDTITIIEEDEEGMMKNI